MAAFLVFVLTVYLAMICMVNFFAPPSFYDSDMYTDIRYAMEAWNHKSVFPGGWVFGNQLYVMSTPVLAALFFGLTGEPAVAMGLASTVMAVFVLLSFAWMIRPVVPSREGRLVGMVLLLGQMLFFGDSWHDPTGWQLMFTMCSYYACYAVNAFFVFGVYLRCGELRKRSFAVLLALCCLFSFATGIQSLRQTAVMTLPLLGMAFLEMVWDFFRKHPVRPKALLTAGAVSVSNLLGLVAARCMDIEQVEIFGEMNLTPISDLLGNLKQSFLLMMSLILNYDLLGFAVFAGLAAICILAVLGILRENRSTILLTGILMLSVLAILAVDTLTTMQVRSIYYFMLYPFTAFLAAWLFSQRKCWIKGAITVLVSVLVILSLVQELPSLFSSVQEGKKEEAWEISDYLTENGYTTLYGAWNQGADIVIASDWELTAGFWEYREDPFFFYKYLCNPDVFRASSDSCAYVFYGSEDAQRAVKKAETRNVEMTLIQHFQESDVYLYTAPVNLMEVFW